MSRNGGLTDFVTKEISEWARVPRDEWKISSEWKQASVENLCGSPWRACANTANDCRRKCRLRRRFQFFWDRAQTAQRDRCIDRKLCRRRHFDKRSSHKCLAFSSACIVHSLAFLFHRGSDRTRPWVRSHRELRELE